jgi:4-amino-4-deoxy-L-arabinose transferase-like glycosyltransferase
MNNTQPLKFANHQLTKHKLPIAIPTPHLCTSMKGYRTVVNLLAVVLTVLPIFINLAEKPIRLFDEAWLAVNAYEIYKRGDMVVITFEGEPDMRNTKPPLMVWIQALMMKVIGVNEWSVRLPAAVAAFICCLVLLSILSKYSHDPLTGLISALIALWRQSLQTA